MGELVHLLTDPAHWAFEGVTDLVFGGVGILVGRFWVRAHDRKHHPEPTGTPVTLEMVQAMMNFQSNLNNMRHRRR